MEICGVPKDEIERRVDELLEIATGESVLDTGLREGLVLRSQDGSQSFKAVSNEFLMITP